MTLPGPLAPRPDDAERLARLAAMKRRATALLALAAAVFAAARAYESRYPWLGYLRAAEEASLVGGLADWCAVTTLFRRPLGLPIPHTAIVATQKDRIGRILGNFVQKHFLSQDVIAARLRGIGPSARAARWLSDPENGRRIARQVAAGLATTLEAAPDEGLQGALQDVLAARVKATRVAPSLGKLLSLLLADNRHHELLHAAVRLAARAVHDNRDFIRQQVKTESPWWVPGVVDDKIYQRIVAAIERLPDDIEANRDHPLRTGFDAAVRDFVDRLQHSPEVIARAEALKEEWLADASVSELSARLWEAM